jgi:nitrilase
VRGKYLIIRKYNMNRITVAAVQMTSTSDMEANLEKAERLLTRGVNMGANLLALPENFSFMGKGESEKLELAETADGGPASGFLKDFARKNKVWIVGGSIAVKAEDGKVFNRSLLIDDQGEIAASYDKIHLFDVDIAGGESHKESRTVKRGDKVVSHKAPFGVIGLSICYDLRFPELYRELGAKGATMIFVPAAFTSQTGEAHWEVLLRARAIENQVYIIAPAQVGIHNKNRSTFGNSMIIDPWGKVIARAPDEETVISAEIDFDYLGSVRQSIPCLSHKRLKS